MSLQNLRDPIALIRADGGSRLGMGHLNRCLSIAKSLTSRRINCVFAVSNRLSEKAIRPYGYQILNIGHENESKQILSYVSKHDNCKVLIIDSKRRAVAHLINRLYKKVRIVIIDNTSATKHADLVVLPGVKKQVRRQPLNSLIGPQYVLTNPNSKRPRLERNGAILFSAGAADKLDITRRVAAAFSKSNADFRMTVVLGKFYRHADRVKSLLKEDRRFTILEDPPNFTSLMCSHSVGIITFGVTVYEAALFRLPALVIAHSRENDASAKIVEKYGWINYLGKYDDIDYDKLVEASIKLLNNGSLLRKMRAAGEIVDGRGADRVADAIVGVMKRTGLP